ncbi:MAG TPA: FAD-dependent thymidylate synthase [Anaerolineales bacterium]|nr:FAD-dependent thymidylate synthase [Anaerolineales bacterium]
MSFSREIYILSPRDLSPETIAVAFAKTSRSPQSFREIATELSSESAAQFHEKWVVGYGHASVAEHAILHIAFENVSRLAIECIESNRLASYTEKSTRYQQWDVNSFYRPASVLQSQWASLYEQTCRLLMQTYTESLAPLQSVIQERFPRKAGESDLAWDNRIRSKYVDVARYLLPAAVFANVGMTANARTLAHAIRKLLSHPLAEVREIGAEVKAVALQETPTLVKYTDPVAYQLHTESQLQSAMYQLPLSNPAQPFAPGKEDWLQIVSHTVQAEEKFLASVLFRYSTKSFEECEQIILSLSTQARTNLLETALGSLQRHDIPLRELEHVQVTFCATMDEGAYYEVKRHRMMTQSPQPLDISLGWEMPSLIVDAGLQESYQTAMQAVCSAYRQMAVTHPEEARYLVPNAFNRRVLVTANLRALYHFCTLRSAKNAHFAVRRIATRLHEELSRLYPSLMQFCYWENREQWQSVSQEYFS